MQENIKEGSEKPSSEKDHKANRLSYHIADYLKLRVERQI